MGSFYYEEFKKKKYPKVNYALLNWICDVLCGVKVKWIGDGIMEWMLDESLTDEHECSYLRTIQILDGFSAPSLGQSVSVVHVGVRMVDLNTAAGRSTL